MNITTSNFKFKNFDLRVINYSASLNPILSYDSRTESTYQLSSNLGHFFHFQFNNHIPDRN